MSERPAIQEAIVAGHLSIVNGRPHAPLPAQEFVLFERKLRRMMRFARLQVGYGLSIRETARLLGCAKATAERHSKIVRKVAKIL